jgi:hypothetical protein
MLWIFKITTLKQAMHRTQITRYLIGVLSGSLLKIHQSSEPFKSVIQTVQVLVLNHAMLLSTANVSSVIALWPAKRTLFWRTEELMFHDVFPNSQWHFLPFQGLHCIPAAENILLDLRCFLWYLNPWSLIETPSFILLFCFFLSAHSPSQLLSIHKFVLDSHNG